MTTQPDIAWLEQAACRDEPSRRFVAPNDDGDVSTALSICQRCPVRQPCLDTALSHRIEADAGIWGGTTPHQRRQIRRGRLQSDVAFGGNRHQTPATPPSPSPEPPQTPTTRPTEVSRLAAPEVTVARDRHGDYASSDGRVLIFRIRGELPWVLAIDDQIIGASRTVTEARRTAWTTLHEAERADARTPQPTVARAHGQRR